MIRKDDPIVSLAMWIRGVRYGMKPSIISLKNKMRSLPIEGLGQDLYIVLNAPSVMTQDLSVLKGKNTMFVNRGFTHPLYQELQPKYHVFVDSKLIKGIWPIKWFDEILKLSPKTKILLPIEWSNNVMFKPYINNIYWLNWEVPFTNLAVAGSCFSFAIQQKFEKIYFTGFDANGIGYEMVKSNNSHFYGNDPELQGKSTKQFAIDLYMHSRYFHELNKFGDYCKKHNIKIINLTNGGLIDMFPRENILPLLNAVE